MDSQLQNFINEVDDLRDIADEVYAKAIQLGLKLNQYVFVTVRYSRAQQRFSSVGSGKQTIGAEQTITVSMGPPSFYTAGSYWMQALPGDPSFKRFFFTPDGVPQDARWMPINSSFLLFDRQSALNQANFSGSSSAPPPPPPSGGGGDGNKFSSFVNVGATPINRGAPVFTVSNSQVRLCKGDTNGRFVSGIYAGVSPLDPGDTGSFLIDGSLISSSIEWQAVTGMVGGLVRGRKYFLDFDIDGKLTMSLNPAAATQSPSYLVNIGYAVTQTEFKLEIQQPIRVL
jgi:hypothetical protein